MQVQTDLRAGGYERCGKCGKTVYRQNNLQFNVNAFNFVLFGSQHVDQENENENG